MALLPRLYPKVSLLWKALSVGPPNTIPGVLLTSTKLCPQGMVLHLPPSESKFNCSKKESWSIPGPAKDPLSCPRVSGRRWERRSLLWCAWVGAPDGHLAVCYLPPRACCKKSLPCNISCTHLEAVKPGQTWFSLPAQPQLPWLNTGITGGAPRVPAGSGAQHPSATPGRKTQWEKREPEPNKAGWPLIPTEQTCPTGEAQTCQKGIAGFPPRRGG